MNPYFITLTFLMLMSALTSSQVVRFTESHFGNQLHASYHESLGTLEAVRAEAGLEDFRDRNGEKQEKDEEVKEEKPPRKESERKSPSLHFNFARPPNNSRLNFFLFLNEEPHKDYPLDMREAFARLMRLLYGESTFFQLGIEYRILDALIAHKEETLNFDYPDDLSTLMLDDVEAQKAFYRMLKGVEGRPSLLNYITFDRIGERCYDQKKVNVMFADPLTLQALVPELANEIVALREPIWEEILDQEMHRKERPLEEFKNRNTYKKELKEALELLLSGEGLKYDPHYKWVFDCSLGKLGNILFIEDPKTLFVHREKL